MDFWPKVIFVFQRRNKIIPGIRMNLKKVQGVEWSVECRVDETKEYQ
jgi:hypothetical protein